MNHMSLYALKNAKSNFKEKDDEVIQKRIRTLINNFANAGLATRQVSNEDLRVLMDNFFNAGRTTRFGTVMS